MRTQITHARAQIASDAPKPRTRLHWPHSALLAAFLDHSLLLAMEHSTALTDHMSALAGLNYD